MPGCASLSRSTGAFRESHDTKTVAAILTWYIEGSHADVIVGKILRGWSYDGGPGPKLRLASLYVDQFPEGDMARTMAENHGIRIYNTIESAIGVGYSGLDIYGIHTLEVFRSFVERRRDGESRVQFVQWFDAERMWTLVDSGSINRSIIPMRPIPSSRNPTALELNTKTIDVPKVEEQPSRTFAFVRPRNTIMLEQEFLYSLAIANQDKFEPAGSSHGPMSKRKNSEF